MINRPILKQMLDFHSGQVARLKEISTDCLECIHYVKKDQHCKQFAADVPDDVVTKGCNEWQYDEIAF